MTTQSTQYTEHELAAHLEIAPEIICHWIEKDFLDAQLDEIGWTVQHSALIDFLDRFSSNVELARGTTRRCAEIATARDTCEMLEQP